MLHDRKQLRTTRWRLSLGYFRLVDLWNKSFCVCINHAMSHSAVLICGCCSAPRVGFRSTSFCYILSPLDIHFVQEWAWGFPQQLPWKKLHFQIPFYTKYKKALFSVPTIFPHDCICHRLRMFCFQNQKCKYWDNYKFYISTEAEKV